jgi:UV DNA damage repair endonuclease
MAIDTKPFVRLGNHKRLPSMHYEHYDGCELEHVACAVLYLAGALDAAQKRLDEYAAEIERLRSLLERRVMGDWSERVQ